MKISSTKTDFYRLFTYFCIIFTTENPAPNINVLKINLNLEFHVKHTGI